MNTNPSFINNPFYFTNQEVAGTKKKIKKPFELNLTKKESNLKENSTMSSASKQYLSQPLLSDTTTGINSFDEHNLEMTNANNAQSDSDHSTIDISLDEIPPHNYLTNDHNTQAQLKDLLLEQSFKANKSEIPLDLLSNCNFTNTEPSKKNLCNEQISQDLFLSQELSTLNINNLSVPKIKLINISQNLNENLPFSTDIIPETELNSVKFKKPRLQKRKAPKKWFTSKTDASTEQALNCSSSSDITFSEVTGNFIEAKNIRSIRARKNTKSKQNMFDKVRDFNSIYNDLSKAAEEAKELYSQLTVGLVKLATEDQDAECLDENMSQLNEASGTSLPNDETVNDTVNDETLKEISAVFKERQKKDTSKTDKFTDEIFELIKFFKSSKI